MLQKDNSIVGDAPKLEPKKEKKTPTKEKNKNKNKKQKNSLGNDRTFEIYFSRNSFCNHLF